VRIFIAVQSSRVTDEELKGSEVATSMVSMGMQALVDNAYRQCAGDDFTLIWDPIFFFGHNHPPMDYEAPPAKKVLKVTQDHIKQVGLQAISSSCRI
jgi:hypothetical protein